MWGVRKPIVNPFESLVLMLSSTIEKECGTELILLYVMNHLYRMWDKNALIPKFLTGYSPCLQVLSTYNNKEAKKSFLETQIDAMTFRTVHCLESTFSG